MNCHFKAPIFVILLFTVGCAYTVPMGTQEQAQSRNIDKTRIDQLSESGDYKIDPEVQPKSDGIHLLKNSDKKDNTCMSETVPGSDSVAARCDTARMLQRMK